MTTAIIPWIEQEMKRRGWGVTRFANEVGVSHGLVRQWLKGERNPSPKSVAKLAQALDEDKDYLLVLAGHRDPDPAGDPDSREERIATLAREVDWTVAGRFDTMRRILTGWIETDRQGADS